MAPSKSCARTLVTAWRSSSGRSRVARMTETAGMDGADDMRTSFLIRRAQAGQTLQLDHLVCWRRHPEPKGGPTWANTLAGLGSAPHSLHIGCPEGGSVPT